MDALLRDTLFGRFVNYISNDKYFSHPDSEWQNWEKYVQVKLPSVATSEDHTGEKSSAPVPEKILDFFGPDDPAIPRNWSSGVKALVALNVMFLNFGFYSASAIFTPSMEDIEKEFNGTTAEGTLGLSLFVIAYGIGPLILSPLSNLPSVGRTPVYVFGCLAFCLFNIGTAVAKNLQTVLVLRFLGGFIGSAPISIGGASLMEIYNPAEIGYAIALYAVSGVCGPILGPLLGTAVNLRWNTWRASVWLIMGITAFTSIFTFFFLPETLSTNILLRRARRIRAKTGDHSCKTQTELAAPENEFFKSLFKQTIDDFRLSCVDPVVIFVNLDTMLVYGILYLWFEFFPYVFNGIYHFTSLQQSLAYFGILVGAFISVICYMLWLYFVYIPKTRDLDNPVEPEARLRPGQVGAVCIPICLFIFAWTSRESVHWIVPIIGTAFFAPGFYLTFQSILNYLGESYPRHAASVFAGNTFFRSSFGGALPLAAPRMLNSLGIGWASSVLGFISVAMLPFPFILERYGKRLRSWSPYAN